MNNDIDLTEFYPDFIQESREQHEQLVQLLDEFEDNPSQSKNLESFGQIIDRIMGAAQSLELHKIGKICELGKQIGYKSSQVDDENLQLVTCGILQDSLDLLEEGLDKLMDNGNDEFLQIDSFLSRLDWLNEKFKNIDRASVAVGKK